MAGCLLALLLSVLVCRDLSAQCDLVSFDSPTPGVLHTTLLNGILETKVVSIPGQTPALKAQASEAFDSKNFAGEYLQPGKLVRIAVFLESSGSGGQTEKKLRLILSGFLTPGDEDTPPEVKWIMAYRPIASNNTLIISNLSGAVKCEQIKESLWKDMIPAPPGFELVEDIIEFTHPDLVYNKIMASFGKNPPAKQPSSVR